MAKTPLTSEDSYCTPVQYTTFTDWRSSADFLSDEGVRLPSKEAVEADENLALLLRAASGQVEEAALVGGRYTPSDLREIADADPVTNATDRLAEIVAGLTLWKVKRRRPDGSPKEEITKDAEFALERLQSGATIFPFQESVDAGVIDSVVESASSHIVPRYGTVVIAERLFGRRGDRTDPARQ